MSETGRFAQQKRIGAVLFLLMSLSGERPTGCSSGCVHSLGCFVDRVLFYKVVQQPIPGNFLTEIIAAQRDLGSWF